MSSMIINDTGLNKQSKLGETEDWQSKNYMERFLENMEKEFEMDKIDDDQEKIKRIILKINAKYWHSVNNFFKYNQQDVITYDSLKSAISTKVRRVFDPRMKKYDTVVDGYIDQLEIVNIDLPNLNNWLKKLRSLCNGEAKEEYLVTKVLNRVVENQREIKFKKLMHAIREDIRLYEERIKINNNIIGKEGKKKLNQKIAIRDTLKKFMD